MKDSLIDLKNGSRFYILEDTAYQNKNYALAVLMNDENVCKMIVVVFEYSLENGQITVKEIDDDHIASDVTALLQAKLQKKDE